MHNVSHTVTGDKLVITVDIGKSAIEAAHPSATGKTYLVGSTGGSLRVETKHCRDLAFSINVMAKK